MTPPGWSSGRPCCSASGWCGALSGIIRHRFAVTNWLTAAYRTVQLVARHATHLGATLSKKVATGEVVAIGTNDLAHMGNLMDVSARAAGAIVSFVVVAVILMQTSVHPRSGRPGRRSPAPAGDRADAASRCSGATCSSAR